MPQGVINHVLNFTNKEISNGDLFYNDRTLIICPVFRFASYNASKELTVVFSMPDNHGYYNNFTSPGNRGEFGQRIIKDLLAELVKKYGELFDSYGYKFEFDFAFYRDRPDILIQRLHTMGEKFKINCTEGSDPDLLTISVGRGISTPYQFTLKYSNTICDNQRHVYTLTIFPDTDRCNKIFFKVPQSDDNPYGCYGIVPIEVIEKALVDVITELQSEAADNPVQSAESSAGYNFTPLGGSSSSSGYPNP